MKNNLYKTYCSGCGLCHSIADVKFEQNEKGHNYPLLDSTDQKILAQVCPAGGAALADFSNIENGIWGNFYAVYLGWSNNKSIRKTASSGGIITTTCCYLLENGLVDGIIQTKANEECVYKTTTVVSETIEDVLQCQGSRYSMSSPLENILELVQESKTYAFVGKPCDVSALRMYLKENSFLQNRIKYLLSFFCAGVPSVDAQKLLLSKLGCLNENECKYLTYRGNGWPGFTTVMKFDGNISRMTYHESWGKILGRDVRKSCRFCLDGIGEGADIACGDLWYLKQDRNPDFTEHEGRNVIFARTELGYELINQIGQNGRVHLENYYSNLEDLKYIQKYQYERKTTMRAMIKAMKICGKDIPKYNDEILKKYSKLASGKLRLKRFVGTIKRILNNKI